MLPETWRPIMRPAILPAGWFHVFNKPESKPELRSQGTETALYPLESAPVSVSFHHGGCHSCVHSRKDKCPSRLQGAALKCFPTMGQGLVGIQRLKRIVFDTSEIKFPVQKKQCRHNQFFIRFLCRYSPNHSSLLLQPCTILKAKSTTNYNHLQPIPTYSNFV